ncbi:twitching motility protein PilT [Thermococcus eurythermalis]|uniref:Twitching motility protein PilT n=1 Tax=Thermococcus eurythermalis TaxID=1505907 RepID=A0A097QVB1_9EURY|nr:LAGLIDADG family homing endonuclease [Thermococcus eurythermalis]AIU70403.1 twitching motility protein PilT [Thermococcus eurythermalis]
MRVFVPDTSVIVDGRLTQFLSTLDEKVKVVVPEAVVAEIEHQANEGKAIGHTGLEELKKLREMAEGGKILLEFYGERPELWQIRRAKAGEIDHMVRETARELNATLITGDQVQRDIAIAKGIDVIYLTAKRGVKHRLEDFFDETTMSVHLKAGVKPLAKKGKPGEWRLVPIRDEPLTDEELEEIADDIVERAKREPDSFIELDEPGATVVQLRNYRIVIAKPPFADRIEITAVRPVKKLSIDDYELSERLLERLKDKAEGILIAGAPGEGKCLPPETPVLLADGTFVPISSLKPGTRVITLSHNKVDVQEVAKVHKRKETRLIKLKTSTGREITLSPNHPVLTIKNGFVVWEDAGNLEVGSPIAVPRKIAVKSDLPEKLWVGELVGEGFFARLKDGSAVPIDKAIPEGTVGVFYRGRNHRSSREIPPFIKLNEEFFEFLGMMWAEGSGSVFEFNNFDEELVEHFKGLVKSLFNVSEEEFYFVSPGRLRVRNSKTIEKLLRALGYPEREKAKTIKVPKLVLRADERRIAAFLKGVFEGDGYIGKELEIATASRDFAHGIHYLLLRLGIPSIVSEKMINGRTYYRVLIKNSEDIRKFYEIVRPRFRVKGFERHFYIKANPNAGTIPAGETIKTLGLLLRRPVKNPLKNSYSPDRLRRIYQEYLQIYRDYVGVERDAKSLIDYMNELNRWREIVEFISSRVSREFYIRNGIDPEGPKLWLEGKRTPMPSTIAKLVSAFHRETGLLEREAKMWVSLSDNVRVLLARIFDRIGRSTYGVMSQPMLSLFLSGAEVRVTTLKELIEKAVEDYYTKAEFIEEYLAHLRLMLDENIFWDRVKEIAVVEGEFEVYDITVPNHNFIAGNTPVLVHNSTFAQALAEWYASMGKIVKTMEKPRDLQVSEEITQYTALSGKMELTGDILLLVRPDYTIFDEMRKTSDFKIYADLRLAGVGMVGVVHATKPIDAIQRFIGRVELGMIPQIVDTVLFIKAGRVAKVLTLEYLVKVPSGMKEEDLARPVIEVRDFETGELEYEIYTYGEEVSVVPVKKEEKAPALRLAEKRLKQEIKKFLPDVYTEVEIVSPHKAVIYADEFDIPAIIGKKGKRITELEKRIGISIDVKSFTEREAEKPKEKIPVEVEEKKKTIVLRVSPDYAKKPLKFYGGEQYVFTATPSKKGLVKVSKSTPIGKELKRLIDAGIPIWAST